MTSIIVGASAGLGRALAEQLSDLGQDLCLVASDVRDLETLASDLRLRYGVQVFVHVHNLSKFDPSVFFRDCFPLLGKVDHLFLIAGKSLIDRDFDGLSDFQIRELIEVNFTSNVLFIRSLLPELLKSKNPNIVGIGSVAVTRPRGRNTVYAASKCGLEFFFGGLRHYLANTPCRLQFYRVGYLDTQMTFGQKSLFPKAKTTVIARAIVAGLNKDRPLKYLPLWWRWVMLVYSTVPWFLFKKMKN